MKLIYNLAFLIFGTLYSPIFFLKLRQAENPRALLGERLGQLPESLKATVRGKRILWLHAVSVGEVRAIEPLTHLWLKRHPDFHVEEFAFNLLALKFSRV